MMSEEEMIDSDYDDLSDSDIIVLLIVDEKRPVSKTRLQKLSLLYHEFYEFCPRCGKHIRFVGLDELSNKLIKDSTYSKDRLYAKFRTFLLSKRLESGLSVSDFAKKCNISGSAIRNYESRGCLPSVPELLRIAHALNTSVYEIFDIKKPGDEANESL